MRKDLRDEETGTLGAVTHSLRSHSKALWKTSSGWAPTILRLDVLGCAGADATGGVIGGRPLDEEGGNPGDAQPPGARLGREQSIQVLPGLKRPSEVLGIEAHFLSGGPEHLEVSDVTTFREVGREDTAAELRKPGVVTRVLGGQDGRARVGEQRRWGERQSELRTPGAEHVMHWGKVCASVQFV